MFKRIIDFSVDHKPIIVFLVFVLVGLGFYSMTQIPIDAVPDITNNQVQVVTSAPSLSPPEIERLITFPLEIALANISNVTEIRSISRYGLSVITIVFKDRVPIYLARQLVNEELQRVKEELLPEYGLPELLPLTSGLGEVFQYTLDVDENYRHRYSPLKLREIQDWIVKRQLSGIPGIVEISSFGGFLKQYEVSLYPDKLRSFGLTCSDVYAALSNNNQNSGGSYIEKNHNAYYIRTEGVLQSIEEIENIVVGSIGNMPVLIKNLAEVKIGHAPRYGAMTKDGKGEAVGGITLMYKGANSSKVINDIKKRIDLIQTSLPEGVKIVPYLDRSEFVKRTTHTVVTNLVEGGLIVIFILILLLGNLRSGIIVASVIPLSLLFGFVMMHLFGVSANLMSLGAIDFGIVVDGAVIIIESILFYLHKNSNFKKLSQKQMDQAVKDASANIYQSAAFGVIIILVVFVPIMTLTGIEGKTFRPMAQTFSFVILGAFILSMTYVPMMSALLFKKDVQRKVTISDKIIKFLKLTYHPVLRISLRYKYSLLGITVLVFFISLWSFTRLGGEFIPTLEEGDLAMQMTVPPGSSLSQSIRMSTRAEQLLLENFPEVEKVVSKIGTAEVPTDPMAVEDADVMIILKDKKEWTSASSREELIEMMKKELAVLPAVSFEFTQPIQLRFNELMTGVKSDIAIKIYGEDLDELFSQANKAEALIRNVDGASDIKVEQVVGLPQLVVTYDRKRLAQYGVNISDLNDIIRAAYAGQKAGVIFEGDRRFDLVIRIHQSERENLDLHRLSIKIPSGQTIPISELADIRFEEGPMQISRENTKRRVTIGINVRNRDVESIVKDIDIILSKNLKLLPGYYIQYGGQFENLEQAQKRLAIAVPVALLLILILLFFTFNSFKYALLIFTAVPLSVVGGIAALWIRDMPFSISAGVGFIALFGVAVLNGIVLISYYVQMQKEGIENVQYIVVKGACTRLRPVLITASTDIIGFLPMALSSSAGAEVQRPLATVVIGGIITSTLLTLIILPILFLLINSKNSRSFRFSFKSGLSLKVIPLLLGLGIGFSFVQAQVNPIIKLDIQQAVQMAIDSNLNLKANQLQIAHANASNMASWQLEPTEFQYYRGNINSKAEDQYIEINQNFGSILSHIYSSRQSQSLTRVYESAYEISKRELQTQVKSAYLFWLYTIKISDLAEKEKEYYSELERVSNLRYQSGETTLLEKAVAGSKALEINSKCSMLANESLIAQNKLKMLLFVQSDLLPASDDLEMYKIAKSSDTSFYEPQLYEQFYSNKAENAKHAEAVEKSMYFPEITFGVFQQNIDDVINLGGWHIDVSFPIWFLPRQSKIKQSKIVSEQVQFEYQSVVLETKAKIENLIIELHNLFLQLRYYNQQALPQADLILETAKTQNSLEEIGYVEFIQAVSTALDIQRNYLEVLNNYNQTAIQLEFYAK